MTLSRSRYLTIAPPSTLRSDFDLKTLSLFKVPLAYVFLESSLILEPILVIKDSLKDLAPI